MDRTPKGFTLLLVWVARIVGLLTLGGYVTLVLFAFQVLDAKVAAPVITLFAGAKLFHDGLIGLRKYIDRTASARVGAFEITLSFLAAVLLVCSVTIQVWG